jgi:Carboxypeptidase regulatory-like domain
LLVPILQSLVLASTTTGETSMKSRIIMPGLVVWALGICLSISMPARAQVAGATLSGTITDAQGGAVVNAKVSVKNLATGVTVDTVTNGNGAYTAPNLNPADYEVSVTALGFSTTATKVTLTVGQKQQLNLALTVGQVSQEIQVTGAAPQVDLESSTISGEVSAATVRELPLNGRDWTSLAALEPGVASVRSQLSVQGSAIAAGRGLGTQMTISGARPTMNSYRLDGIIVNDYSNAGPGSVLGKNLGVDAIQEFTVLTSNYSAEYGFTSGGVINAVTRSGTNSFHGTAFEFVRNDKLDATNFFSNAGGLPKNPLRQNQFGAAGGWKILKDKLFLFGDYEGVRFVKSVPHTGDTTLTPAVQSGVVTNLFTGVTTTVAVDPNIQKYLGFWPAPSPGFDTPGGIGCLPLSSKFYNPGGCNPDVAKFIWQGSQHATENFYTFRGDYRISDKDSIFSTYLHDFSKLDIPQPLENVTQEYDSWRQAIIIEETHVFSAAWANSFRLGLDRTSDFGGHTSIALNPLAADPTLAMAPGFYSPNIALTGAGVTSATSGLVWGGSVQDYRGQIFQVFDDAFASRGNHGFKFGFEFLADQTDGYHPLSGGNGNGNGTFSFAGTYPVTGGSTKVATAAEGNTAGNVGVGGGCYNPATAGGPTAKNLANGNNYDNACGTLVNFLTDQPISAYQPTDVLNLPFHHLRDKIFGVYLQDDWRVRPSLTVNLGLRYEMSTIPTENRGLIANLNSITQILPCFPASVLPDISCLSPSDPTALLSNVFFTRNPTTLNFEPRIGFAWDPFHNGKTSVRGGFGLFDALPLPYELILNSVSTAPYRNIRTVIGPPGIRSPNSLAGAPDQWPFNIVALSNTPAVPSPAATNTRTWNYVERAPSRNYVYQYNFNIQRQITSNMTILVGYMGSRGLHNPFQVDSTNHILPTKAANGDYYWPIPYTGNLSASAQQNLLLNPSVAGIPSTMWQSSSWYNALTVKVDKRMSHGFQVQGSFTWSKSIDNSSGSAAGDTFAFDYTSLPWYDLSLNKGLSDFDVRRNLVINGLWNVPTPTALGVFGDRVLGGWQLGVILNLSDGVPTFPSIATSSPDMLGEDIATVQPPNVAAGCSPQNLVNPNYRHTLFYTNLSCLSLVPMTAANASYCDQRLGAGTCSNIRGDLGRNTLIGPGLVNVDFSAFKNNYVPRISETFNVQFRAEFFNVLNHTNFAPSGNLAPFTQGGVPNTGTFGQLTSTQGQNREIQLALKLVW